MPTGFSIVNGICGTHERPADPHRRYPDPAALRGRLSSRLSGGGLPGSGPPARPRLHRLGVGTGSPCRVLLHPHGDPVRALPLHRGHARAGAVPRQRPLHGFALLRVPRLRCLLPGAPLPRAEAGGRRRRPVGAADDAPGRRGRSGGGPGGPAGAVAGPPRGGAGLYSGVLVFTLAVRWWIGEPLLLAAGLLLHAAVLLGLW